MPYKIIDKIQKKINKSKKQITYSNQLKVDKIKQKKELLSLINELLEKNINQLKHTITINNSLDKRSYLKGKIDILKELKEYKLK